MTACHAAQEALGRGVPTAQVIEERAASALSRRRFLQLGAALLPATVAPSLLRAARPRPGSARVVIVGAGLAGLTCAHRLRQAGIAATVYEASDRAGGRCWTRRGAFRDGQLAEHGGELIDQSHAAIRQLVQELGLTTDNLLQAEANSSEPLYHFDGAPYTYAQATDDLKGIWSKLHRDLSQASYPTTFDSFTPRGAQLDRLSIVDWIEETVPGGMASRLGQLLEVAYTIEYGGEASEQSALNLIYLLGYSGPGKFRLFGPSNEKYRVRGGNDQIGERLASELSGQIVTGRPLVAVRQHANGTFTLTFGGGRALDVVADKVVLALPFSILRSSVDLRRAGFSPLKLTAIRELGMGTSSKLHLQFTARPWEGLGANGETFADTGYQCTWDASRGQAGASGLIVNYTGGAYGAGFDSGTLASRAAQFLLQINPVLPGLASRWNGLATIDHWLSHPHTRGSYSFWKVGQYTSFAGIERARESNAHFCGEHTSIDFQGYLNGAVETGERAAGEVMADLR